MSNSPLTPLSPRAIRKHSHYSKLLSALKSILIDRGGGWAAVIAACFNRNPEAGSSIASQRAAAVAVAERFSATGEHQGEDTAHAELSRIGIEGILHYLDVPSLVSHHLRPEYTFASPSSSASADRTVSGERLSPCKHTLNASNCLLYKGSGYFQPKGCLGKFAREVQYLFQKPPASCPRTPTRTSHARRLSGKVCLSART